MSWRTSKEYQKKPKRCSKCRMEKDQGDFYKNSYRCKDCDRAKCRAYQQKKRKLPGPKECKACSEEFTPHIRTPYQKYCSIRCQQKWLRENTSKLKKCKHCGEEFRKWNANKYCGKRCQGLAARERRKGKRNPNYKGGRHLDTGRRQQKEYLEAFLAKNDYLFCEMCSKSEALKFDVHHIIYRSEAKNHEHLHNKKNLVLLCRSCHQWVHRKKNRRDDIVKERRLWELFDHIQPML